MKVVTWNVNSLKVRLGQVQGWLAENQPDVLCLQETKTEDVNFPLSEIQQTGYQVAYSGQKTYNGVAIISKLAMSDIQYGIPNFTDVQKRVLAATVDGIRIICVYIPNGESVESDKYQYKLTWLASLHSWLQEEMKRYPKLVLLGDYNILWRGQVKFYAANQSARLSKVCSNLVCAMHFVCLSRQKNPTAGGITA
jgi:exodeoxyribonuclease-3